jgi:transposase
MDKMAIIKLKQQGMSDRKVAEACGVNRKTVAKYWKEFQMKEDELRNTTDPVKICEIQEQLLSKPKYKATKRLPYKYTEQMDEFLDEILSNEEEKTKDLGSTHKQQLTITQIHNKFKNKGFDIGKSVIAKHLQEKRTKLKTVYIRQQYDYGDRLEYDFGEVRLKINEEVDTYYLAVLASAATNFRWAYLYKNMKKEVFQDSHVRFFEMIGGVYKEVVYDNMKNVVSRFLGKNEKELNEDLIKMAAYYGFTINVTNAFSGNEKGSVEESVKVSRNQVFAEEYKFETFKQAEEYLENRLKEMNTDSGFEKEQPYLLEYKPPLQTARVRKQKPDKYCFISVDKNLYSVPESVMGKEVTVKIYVEHIDVYDDNVFLCTYKKREGEGVITVNIFHYLNTFSKKPGAIKNSRALKDRLELKDIFDKYFIDKPREFIDLLRNNQNKSSKDLISFFDSYCSQPIDTKQQQIIRQNIDVNIKGQIAKINQLFFNQDGSTNDD